MQSQYTPVHPNSKQSPLSDRNEKRNPSSSQQGNGKNSLYPSSEAKNELSSFFPWLFTGKRPGVSDEGRHSLTLTFFLTRDVFDSHS